MNNDGRFLFFPPLQANSNEIVLASTHDVQELDVSSLLAAQPYIWIGEEYDRESKRLASLFYLIHSFRVNKESNHCTVFFPHSSDDLDFRGSTTAIHQSGVAPFHLGHMQSSSSMPWLGSGQTSTGAGIVCSFCSLHYKILYNSADTHWYMHTVIFFCLSTIKNINPLMYVYIMDCFA